MFMDDRMMGNKLLVMGKILTVIGKTVTVMGNTVNMKMVMDHGIGYCGKTRGEHDIT